jgi:hypothetical protein
MNPSASAAVLAPPVVVFVDPVNLFEPSDLVSQLLVLGGFVAFVLFVYSGIYSRSSCRLTPVDDTP